MNKLFTKVQNAIAIRKMESPRPRKAPRWSSTACSSSASPWSSVSPLRRSAPHLGALFNAHSRPDRAAGGASGVSWTTRLLRPHFPVFEFFQRRRSMTNRRRDDRGAVMVEFAIILPILLMLLMGIIEFGRAYNIQVSIQAAAREGARELALAHNRADVDSAVHADAPSVTIDSIAQTPCPARATARRRSSSPSTTRSASRSSRSAPRPSRPQE